MTDLGVALGLCHLSPSSFARVLELPPIHREGRLVWGLTGRAGPAGVWVLHPPLLQAPVSAPGSEVELKGGEKGFFLGCGGAKSPSMQEWILTGDFLGSLQPHFEA